MIFGFCYLGFFGLLLAFVLLQMRKFIAKFSNKSALCVKISKAKTDKTLFELLLPYSSADKIIDETLKKLEENLYQGKNHKIDKKALMKSFKIKFKLT